MFPGIVLRNEWIFSLYLTNDYLNERVGHIIVECRPSSRNIREKLFISSSILLWYIGFNEASPTIAAASFCIFNGDYLTHMRVREAYISHMLLVVWICAHLRVQMWYQDEMNVCLLQCLDESTFVRETPFQFYTERKVVITVYCTFTHLSLAVPSNPKLQALWKYSTVLLLWTQMLPPVIPRSFKTPVYATQQQWMKMGMWEMIGKANEST